MKIHKIKKLKLKFYVYNFMKKSTSYPCTAPTHPLTHTHTGARPERGARAPSVRLHLRRGAQRRDILRGQGPSGRSAPLGWGVSACNGRAPRRTYHRRGAAPQGVCVCACVCLCPDMLCVIYMAHITDEALLRKVCVCACVSVYVLTCYM